MRRYRLALIAAAVTPIVAAVLFVVHLNLWVSIAERHGLDTTDWGLAIVIAFLQVMVAMCAGMAAWRAWLARGRRAESIVWSAVVAAVDLCAGLLALFSTGPHYFVSDLPNYLGLLVILASVWWLLAAAAARTTQA